MNIQNRPLLFSLLLASSLFVPAMASSGAQATADEIIEKHLAAVGGRDALAKLTSQKATGTMTIATPNGDLTGPVEMLSKAPNKARPASCSNFHLSVCAQRWRKLTFPFSK